MEQQITAAIAAGFQTILNNPSAQQQEMTQAARELREAALVMKSVARDEFVASGGLKITQATPSAKGVPSRARHAGNVATAMQQTAEQYLREDLGAKIAESHGVRDTDLAAAVYEGGLPGLSRVTRSGIRNSIFNAIGSRVQNTLAADPNDVTIMDEQGRLRDQHGRFLHSATGYLRDASGQIRMIGRGISMDAHGRFRDSSGRFVSAANAATAVDEESFAKSITHYNRTMAAKSVAMRGLEAWRNGEPVSRALMSSLPEGALRVGGAILAGAAIAKTGWDWAQGQYAKNHELQQYYGGSNSDQWGDRLSQFTNHLRGMFTLQGAGQYDEYFNQAMQLGLRGSRRDAYINSAADMYDTGASTRDIGSILGIANEAGHSLGGFAQILRDVGNAARDAGISAARSRDVFIANYKASSDMMFTEGTKEFAGQMAQAQAGLPNRFADLSLTNLYTNTSKDFLYASQSGMNVMDFRSAANEDPSLRVRMSEEWAKRQLSMLRSMKTRATFPATIAAFLAQLGAPYNSQWHSELMGAWIEKNGFLRETIGMIVRMTQDFGEGEMSDADALIWAGELFIEGQSVGSQQQKEEAAQAQSLSPITTSAQSSVTQDWMHQWAGGPDTTWSALETTYLKTLSVDNNPRQGMAAGRTRYPVVEEMIQRASEFGITNKTKVAVYTKDGWIEVNMAQAITDFPDQLQGGIARIRSGGGEMTINRTIPEILGYSNSLSSQFSPETVSSAGRSYSGGTPIPAPLGSEGALEGVNTSPPRSVTGSDGITGSLGPNFPEGGTSQTVVVTLDPTVRDILRISGGDSPYSTGVNRSAPGAAGLVRN